MRYIIFTIRTWLMACNVLDSIPARQIRTAMLVAMQLIMQHWYILMTPTQLKTSAINIFYLWFPYTKTSNKACQPFKNSFHKSRQWSKQMFNKSSHIKREITYLPIIMMGFRFAKNNFQRLAACWAHFFQKIGIRILCIENILYKQN